MGTNALCSALQVWEYFLRLIFPPSAGRSDANRARDVQPKQVSVFVFQVWAGEGGWEASLSCLFDFQ